MYLGAMEKGQKRWMWSQKIYLTESLEEVQKRRLNNMKTKIKTLCLVCIMLLTFLLSPPLVAKSYADYWDGNHSFVEAMREYEKLIKHDPGADICRALEFRGYVVGVSDTYTIFLKYNIPEGSDSGQICAIVVKFLKEHPEKWHEPASPLIIEALMEAFGPAK